MDASTTTRPGKAPAKAAPERANARRGDRTGEHASTHPGKRGNKHPDEHTNNQADGNTDGNPTENPVRLTREHPGAPPDKRTNERPGKHANNRTPERPPEPTADRADEHAHRPPTEQTHEHPTEPPRSRPRGRPPNPPETRLATRDRLIRTGLAVLTEQGFSASGLDMILKKTGIPKGSFYYYFASKEEFGHALIAAYAEYFNAKLDHWLTDTRSTPQTRIRNFMGDAIAGMARHDFRRGCLIGNLGHELAILPDGFREVLCAVMTGWERRMATCIAQIDTTRIDTPRIEKNKIERAKIDTGKLKHAQPASNTTINPARANTLAAFFWSGWEGAVLRARLEQNAAPLETFGQLFMTLLQEKGNSDV